MMINRGQLSLLSLLIIKPLNITVVITIIAVRNKLIHSQIASRTIVLYYQSRPLGSEVALVALGWALSDSQILSETKREDDPANRRDEITRV